MGFGENLKRIRKEKRMTQAELARRIGVSRSVISNYEAGNRFKIAKPYITAIAQALEVLPSALVGHGESFQVETEDGLRSTFFNPPVGDPAHLLTEIEISQIKYQINYRMNEELNYAGIEELDRHSEILATHPKYKKRPEQESRYQRTEDRTKPEPQDE